MNKILGIKNIILQILGAINYQGDTEKAADGFVNLILETGYVDLLLSKSETERALIKQELIAVGEKEDDVISVLQKHFDRTVIASTMENSAKKVLSDYLKEVSITLNSAQIQQLQELFSQNSDS